MTFDKNKPFEALEVNPAAGDHPVSQDPIERQAAILAARRTYAMHPYYAWRFGAQGLNFAQSDSFWLPSVP